MKSKHYVQAGPHTWVEITPEMEQVMRRGQRERFWIFIAAVATVCITAGGCLWAVLR